MPEILCFMLLGYLIAVQFLQRSTFKLKELSCLELPVAQSGEPKELSLPLHFTAATNSTSVVII